MARVMAVVIDVARAALLRPDALARCRDLRLVVAASLVLGTHLVMAAPALFHPALPPLGTLLAVAAFRWAVLSAATWFVASAFYQKDVDLRSVLNIVAVAHLGLLAGLVPVAGLLQFIAGLVWSSAIAVRGLAASFSLDPRTAGAALGIGFLALVLIASTFAVPGFVQT